jgi:hypothetical protein
VTLLFRLDCNLNRVLRQWGANRPIWFELGEWLVGIGLLPSHVLLCEGWNAYRTATACSERLHAGAATCVLLVYIYIYRERLVRNSDSLLSHKSATDVVCCIQGYDHGSLGPRAWSSYGGINLCGMPGNNLVKEVQCGGSASEFSGCLVISCVAGVNGLRLMRVFSAIPWML